MLKTQGAGMAAMQDAGRQLFGPTFHAEGLDFAGRLDALIFRELFELNRVRRTPESEADLRRLYREHLIKRLASSPNAHSLPGAIELVQAARAGGCHEIGLLTGNFPETGVLKLAACGFDPGWFTCCAWGDDSPHEPPSRDYLPPIAMQRYRQRLGSEISADRVTIIGDTPHDVRCAKVNGCRCIAVATGAFSIEELARAGASEVVADLTDTGRLLELLTPARHIAA